MTLLFLDQYPQEKPNVGKLVHLSEGFIIMQFMNTIWVPKLAHPIENNPDSNTYQWDTDVLAKTPDNHFDSFIGTIRPMKPQRQPLGTTSALLGPTFAQRHSCLACVSLWWHCINSLALYTTHVVPLRHCATPCWLCVIDIFGSLRLQATNIHNSRDS